MLYIVPTPIGNLKDITIRALETLKEVDEILCEDTRQSIKLLKAYEIEKPLTSYHEHSKENVRSRVLKEMEQGKVFALVSDGGMPLISDPGFKLVHEIIRSGVKVECLPGPSAGITALAVSGLAVDQYSFFGFLSQKSAGRKKELEAVVEREETLVFYESPYRLMKSLEDMKNVFGDREAVVARELTKKFEEVRRGYLSEVIDHFSKKTIKGEIVILVAGKGRKEMFC